VPDGRAGRHVVIVDPEATATSEVADSFVKISRGADFEIIWALRSLLRGHSIPDSVGGISRQDLTALYERMLNCRYGVVFFGMGLAGQAGGHHAVQALLELVIELNERTHFVARRMRIPGDVAGADSVLCWQTGYPFSVSLGRGYPRYNPGEYTASVLLENREVDCVILVGGEGVRKMSETAQQNLRNIPTILLDYPGRYDFPNPAIRFTTAVYGVHRDGVAYRMDEVPVPLKAFLSSPLPADHEVLAAMTQALRQQASLADTQARDSNDQTRLNG
jgi:formylmethanofuran dehydrogenase subunit B